MSEQVLPFYLVCDESGSMAGHIDHLNNKLLPELHNAIGVDPVTADKTRFCVIGFAEDARVLLPMSDLSEIQDMPGLTPRGTTSYGSAFALLKSQIEADVKALKKEGAQVFRPAVFFISDGEPTDEKQWRKAHQALTDTSFPYYPKIISFGLDGTSRADIISEVSTFKAFIIENGADPSAALREFAHALTQSITHSGAGDRSQSGAPMTLQVPDQVPGFTALAVDAL